MKATDMSKDKANTPIKTLHLTFNLPIWGRQINRWRGAFVEMAGWAEDLCHNHQGEDGVLYRYPLVQYRVNRGQAGIFAVNEGVGALQRVLATSDWNLRWDDEPVSLQIDDLRMHEHYLRLLKEPRQYRLRHWLALNQENYAKWQDANGLLGKVGLLQKLLENHIMSALWGIGWDSEERVEVQLEDLERMKPVDYHGTRLIAFDVAFNCNVLLPLGMGVGKGTSHGFGAVEQVRVQKAEQRKVKSTIHQGESS